MKEEATAPPLLNAEAAVAAKEEARKRLGYIRRIVHIMLDDYACQDDGLLQAFCQSDLRLSMEIFSTLRGC